MAILWSRQTQGKHYEVRRAGRSLRLYTDGTFHSQYNPSAPLGGHIWDLLALPALFRETPPVRVLVLGVGGGAVIRQLAQLLPAPAIVGVELDPIHLQIAKRHFGLGSIPGVKLVCAEASRWLRGYRGPAFDLIIDDLFAENNGDPKRAIAMDADWCRLLLKHLAMRGTLVANFESFRSLKRSALCAAEGEGFQQAFSLSVPGYENRIGAFFRSEASPETMRSKLRQLEEGGQGGLSGRLRARVRRL